CARTSATCSSRSRWRTSRAASCPSASTSSRGTRMRGLVAERPRVPRPDIDDVAARELEQLGLVARQLRIETLAVVAHELDARLEAEAHDPLDLRLPGGP